MAVWSLWVSYVTWVSFGCNSQKPSGAILSTKPMSHKNTPSNWDTEENLESLCHQLLSVYLLHLSFFSGFPVRVPTSQDLTRLHSVVQQPREKETDFLFPFSLLSLTLFPCPPAASSKIPRVRTGLGQVPTLGPINCRDKAMSQGRKTWGQAIDPNREKIHPRRWAPGPRAAAMWVLADSSTESATRGMGVLEKLVETLDLLHNMCTITVIKLCKVHGVHETPVIRFFIFIFIF